MAARGVAAIPRTKSRGSQFVSKEVPLYYQLASLLREGITAGRHAPGDQIPTEADLVEEYGLSRITVRQALSSLEEEGLIRREPGRGTFVTDRQPFAGRLQLDGTIEDLISMGSATSVKLLDMGEVAATPDDAAVLQVEAGTALTRISRIRYYHQEPYSFIVNHLPATTGRKISRGYMRHGSMLKFLEEKLGIPLRDAEQSVRATLADARLARWLKTRIGSPLLFVDRVVRTDEGRPVMRTLVYYRSDIYSFTVHLTRDPKRAKTQHVGWALKKRKDTAK
ncbi:MAG: GntR family transcriptional regulator [Acidobacteria bacterium]|nr:GntR family transcriptional regulator [Acidobacteriota bacterium]